VHPKGLVQTKLKESFMSEVEDREQIRELYSRYAITIDEGDSDNWVKCFTEDGVFESPRLGRHSGQQGLRKFTGIYKDSLHGAQVRHVISNLSLQLEGNHGTGICYLTYYHSKAGKSELAAVGGYRDTLQKVDGRWLFASRKVFID
jgi:3-phenylpropionate/cinnamic acid dioxygenase small subunit